VGFFERRDMTRRDSDRRRCVEWRCVGRGHGVSWVSWYVMERRCVEWRCVGRAPPRSTKGPAPGDAGALRRHGPSRARASRAPPRRRRRLRRGRGRRHCDTAVVCGGGSAVGAHRLRRCLILHRITRNYK
jgi:hypothetical protein